MNEKELIKETADITDGLYNAYGSGTGVLFGIPSELRPSVASIIKSVIKKKSEVDEAKVKNTIERHFVHGYTGDGTVHSSNCRMCKALKELGLDALNSGKDKK